MDQLSYHEGTRALAGGAFRAHPVACHPSFITRHPRLPALSALVALCATCLCAAGCRAPVGQELLSRENRELEDENYQLQGLIEDQCNLIDDLSEENRRLKEHRQSLDGRMRGEPSLLKRDRGIAPEKSPGSAPSDSWREPGRDKESDELPAPVVEPGETSSRIRNSIEVTTLRVDRRFRPATEKQPAGLAVRLWLKDQKGTALAAAGAVSLVASLPGEQGEFRRVARWDFSPQEIAARLRRTSQGEAIYLDLDWPVNVPEDSPLRLYVQFGTSDNRVVRADVPLDRHPLAAGETDWSAVSPPARLAGHAEESKTSAPQEAKAPPRKPQWSPNR